MINFDQVATSKFEVIITYPGYCGVDYAGSYHDCQCHINRRMCNALERLVPKPFTLGLFSIALNRLITPDEEKEVAKQPGIIPG